jgi:putative flippase GtrA
MHPITLFRALSAKYVIIGFASVGAVSTVLDIAVYNIFLHLKFPVKFSAVMGFIAGLINGYILNVTLFFQEHQTTASFVKYGLISLGGLVLTLWIIHLLHIKWEKLSPNEAKVVAVVIVFFWNFTLSNFWAFR